MPEDDKNAVAPADDSLEAPDGTPSPFDTPPPLPPKDSLTQRLRQRTNIYLLTFVLLLLISSAIVYFVVKASKPSSNVANTSSLTSSQLAALKGNTTLVGDAKQTLDVQSNSIFEGQVLLRSDLNVAGALKVGGGLSLESINISGPGTINGQLTVGGGLSVGGDSVLQGNLTVQKNLTVTGSASFGSLSVSTLNVTSLALKSDLSISRHIVTSGGTPSRSNGTALGSGGTASVSGSDTAGTVNINTGSGPPAGCFVTLNFAQHFGSTPHVVISPTTSTGGSLQYYVSPTASGFSICTANAPSAGTGYVFDYIVVD